MCTASANPCPSGTWQTVARLTGAPAITVLPQASFVHIDASGPTAGGGWGSKQDETSNNAKDARGSEHDDFGDL
jgi:hypothetical protein